MSIRALLEPMPTVIYLVPKEGAAKSLMPLNSFVISLADLSMAVSSYC